MSDSGREPGEALPHDEEPPRTAKPMGPGLKRFLVACVFLGLAMMVVPLVISLFGIGTASYGVEEGLRGATHRPDLQQKVGFAFNTTFAMALIAPPGVLLFVFAGLSLAAEHKRKTDAARLGAAARAEADGPSTTSAS